MLVSFSDCNRKNVLLHDTNIKFEKDFCTYRLFYEVSSYHHMWYSQDIHILSHVILPWYSYIIKCDTSKIFTYYTQRIIRLWLSTLLAIITKTDSTCICRYTKPEFMLSTPALYVPVTILCWQGDVGSQKLPNVFHNRPVGC